MAESAAVAVTAPVAAPAGLPAQPIVAAKVAGETFAQQMERFGGFTTADGKPAPADAEPSAPAPDKADAKLSKKGKKAAAAAAKKQAAASPAVAAAVEAAPAAAVQAAAPAVDKLAQLRALATELQMEVDGAGVTARERIEFRQQKKELNDRIARQEQEVIQRLEQAKQQFSGELEYARALKKAKADGDYEKVAQLLGDKDWNALQEDVIARISDPNYKRLRELEQRDAAREAEKQQQLQGQQRQQQAQQRQAALQAHTQQLQAQMRASTDPLVAAMHDDPQFVASVIEIQRQNWDGQSTVSPEKAIKIAAQGFTAPLQAHMKGLYERLQKVFGATPAQAAAVVQAATPAVAAAVAAAEPAAPAAKKNKTAVVPAASVDAASAPSTKMTRKEKDALFSKRLREAIAEDDGTR